MGAGAPRRLGRWYEPRVEILRWLHLVAMAFFVGGQLLLALVVVPALRGSATGPLDAGKRLIMRRAARRFGYGSLVALGVLVLTGSAMAGEEGAWGEPELHAKLALVALSAGLIAWHARRPERHALAAAILVASLAIVFLGVLLAH
jgi:putative copper export protein